MLRPSIIAAIGSAAAIVAAVLTLSPDRDEAPEAPLLAETGSPPLPQQAEGGKALPMVDVVRIGAFGDAMIAGHAAAKAEVVVMDLGHEPAPREIGRVVADPRGEWIFVPDKPLGPGPWVIAPAVAGGESPPTGDVPFLALSVPSGDEPQKKDSGDEPQKKDHGADPQKGNGAVALAVGPQGLNRLLLPAEAAPLAVAVIDGDPEGRIFIGGRAEAQAVVHVYLDNRFVGRSSADDSGMWRVAARAPRDGIHSVRVDQVDGRGKVLRRAEQAFEEGAASPAPVTARAEGGGWRVVRRSAATGVVTTVVCQDGRAQKRGPDLIYPGQVFSVPGR